MNAEHPSADHPETPLILAHGAGSCADFLHRAFPPAACSVPVVALEDRSGDVQQIQAGLLAAAAAAAPARVLLGGVSIGAHAAALACLAAAPGSVLGCVLVMPAWTGRPAAGSVTFLAAREVRVHGSQYVLRRLANDPSLHRDWVTSELQSAWRDRVTLADELRTAAGGIAPSRQQLQCIAVPALVLGITDDPFHPLDVARSWAALVPDCEFVALPRQAPGLDRSVFGQQVGAWLGRRFSAPR